MGFDIDINKLTGEWKKWAEEADSKGTNDGQFINSAFEVEYVKNQARLNGKTDDDIMAVFGANFSSTQTDVSVPTDKSGKKDAITMQQHILKNLSPQEAKVFIDNSKEKPNWKVFVDNVRANIMLYPERLGNDADYYSRLVGEMEFVADALKDKTYNSKADIQNIYNSVKADVAKDANDPFRDFKLQVLEGFLKFAEAHQIQKEKTIVQDRYTELTKGGMPREDAVNKLNKEFNSRGSYYIDYPYNIDEYIDLASEDNDIQNNNKNFSLHSGILSTVEKDFVLGEARTQVEAAINNQRQSKKQNLEQDVEKYLRDNGLYDEYMKVKTDSKDIEKDAIIYLKAKGQYDKYSKKILRGRVDMTFAEIMRFEKSPVKTLRDSVATDNQVGVNKAKQFTRKEFTDVLKDDTVFEGLRGIGNNKDIKLDPPLITENPEKDENGNTTYNLSNLAGVIALHLGADLKANRQINIMKPYSEVERTIIDISAKLGFQVSKKDVKHLMELCGFKVEGKNVVRIMYDAVAGTAVDSLISLAGILGVTADSTATATATAHSVIDKAVATYSGERGPFTIDFDYEKTLIDHFIDNNNLDVNINVVLNGLGTMIVDEDNLYDNSNLSWRDVNITQNGNVLSIVIHKDNTTTVDLIRELKEKLFKNVSAEDLGIDWDQYELDLLHHAEVDKVDTEVDQKTKIKNAIIRSMILGLAINVLKSAMKEQPEVPITVTQFDNISIEEYMARLDMEVQKGTLNSAQANGLKALAAVFVPKDEDGADIRNEDGTRKWECNEFKALLNSMAGDGSVLNAKEGYIAFSRIDEIAEEYGKVEIKKKEPVETPTVIQIEGYQYTMPQEETEPITEPVTTPTQDSGLEVKRVVTQQELQPIAFTRWNDVVSGYSCLQKQEFSEKMKSNATLGNRITKILQAISAKEGDDPKVVYNVRTIADFAKDADAIGTKNKEALQVLANSDKYAQLQIDIDKYLTIMNSDIGMVGGVLAPPLYDPRDEVNGNDGVCTHNGHKGKPLSDDELGGTGTGIQVQRRVINGEVRYYERRIGEEEWKPSDETTYNNPNNRKVT